MCYSIQRFEIFSLRKLAVLCKADSLEGYTLQLDQGDSGEMQYFMLTTIQAATNSFSIANKLGEGGFGPVYRGKLDDGKEIAVKRLSKNSGQGLDEFKTEVRLIVKLQHKNLVRLLGCCIEGDEKLLVYEYMANTSLDAFLFDPIKCRELDWPKRANIVDGIAKGLRYLHEDSRLKTIHRDMKASNGLFSTKSDVYSFGVMMLEIITGKRNRGFYGAEHVENLAWRVWKEGKGQLLIDQNLVESCPLTEALRWINIALLCVQENPADRPTMSTVVFMLGGQLTSLPQPSEPPFSEAIGWYRNCMVRYSNWTIFHTTESLPSGYMTNPKNASNTSQFNMALATFLYNLRGEAARGDSVHKFATGYTTL
ncbi:hypothetical protein RJ640_005501 [Escallonia rubra]|uniref:non-specific serine/threonine protein kinase n=1 Tax=Escallonia rubra TaxID=112253 RepID=A0AA88UMW9_9ASTE|nr:hypothetical protein RJ640_005501 [Escallonia rubra]